MNNPQPVTQAVVRQLLHEALEAPTVRLEQEAWNQIVGTAPLWSHAATYCAYRRHALDAIENGFDKSASSVLSLIEILKQRAPGPKDPEVYAIPDTRALVYLWRTDDGPKPVVLERAPKVEPPAQDGPVAEAYWHWPDQWRQVRITKLHDKSEWLLDLSDSVTIKWSPPARGSDETAKVTSFDDRLSTPCADPRCPADSIAECGHASMADKLGADLPVPLNPGPGRVRCQPCTDKDYASVEVYHVPPACDDPSVAPCEACGKVKCRENGEMVCRSPGCSANPCDNPNGCWPGCTHGVTPLEHPDGSPEHAFATENLRERAAGYREATERSRRVREDLQLGPNPDLESSVLRVMECGHVRDLDLFKNDPALKRDGCTHPDSCGCHPCAGPEDKENPGHAIWCSVCAGADPYCGDLPGGGHHPQCDLFDPGPVDKAAPDPGDMQQCDGWHGPETMDGWDNPCTVDHDQDPDGPIFYDSTGPEPNNGWTNTPVDPGDPRLGKHVDTDTDSEADTPGTRPEDSAPSATGGDSDPSGEDERVCSTLGDHEGPCDDRCFDTLEESDEKLCDELHPETGVRCEEKALHNFTCGYAGDGALERIWWDAKRPDPTPPAAPTSSTATEGSTDSGEPEGGFWDGSGIMPDARCACGHNGQDHDHRTKRCAACTICEGFKAERQCQGSWAAHNGACGAGDCVALERCMCGCARVTHSRPNDACARCPCILFRAGEPEPLVTEEMEARAVRDRKFRFAGDLDMTKVRKQRKTKKGWKCCELCLLAVKEGDQWVSRLGRSVNKRAHLSCANEIAKEMANATAK